ncbi:hypothetical protein NEUTE1DRAFT_49651 [Neurospora tetrasperma FGSC 2508]|uniref:Distal membrane-arm assembly complex protein 1-like domain-containing protein n=1 Tax=Neurospora tetrasperma (strain FGSC 2508 / ATCC MYA-4615 / P0657) TaxID=510951 RepID=F8MXM3_NEUT8|nr:uncharacterized protein NEUTE1DRAFT_49651 [Neurospora tetrasperma FGSC 2508]EGO54494.1 hypothetical protein NEUTE1DRAFT_49651 [Neurospora tetrasperma FGSC 2508]EGZ68054.1 hypothetical protein NEUTE2DRAFT_74475 [Neurospora tetrasperma FGSC 2509]
MAKDSIPPLHTLERPEKLQDILKQDRGDDCLPCRVIGGGAFLGLAAYSYYSGHSQLTKAQAEILASKSFFGMRSRRWAITGLSCGMAYLGLYRLFK